MLITSQWSKLAENYEKHNLNAMCCLNASQETIIHARINFKPTDMTVAANLLGGLNLHDKTAQRYTIYKQVLSHNYQVLSLQM
jgi:hypothetical protein